MLFLQKRQSLPSVFVSQGDTAVQSKVSHASAHGDNLQGPDNDQQWTRTDRGKCSQDMFEPLAYLYGHCKNETNHLPLFQGF